MNYIKSIKLGLFSTGFFFLVMACQKLEDLNVNPNEPETVLMSNLLPNITKDLANVLVNQSFLFSNNAAQLTAKAAQTQVDVYNWNGFDVWKSLYTILLDVHDLENKAKSSGNDAFLGVAIILKSYIFSIITDMYGPAPYSEALKGASENIISPKYDTQQFIYLDSTSGLLAALSSANALLSTNTHSIDGDILFGGNLTQWKKFANSLSLRFLLRVSKKENVASALSSLLSNPNNLMSSNADNAALIYLGISPNRNPILELNTTEFEAVRISNNLVTVFQNTKDPRLAAYARPTDATINLPIDSAQYIGLPNACSPNTNASRLGYSYHDYPGHPLAGTKASAIFMSYSEVQFLIAEAIQRGFLTGNAATHYRNGIESSMDYYNVNYTNFGWADFNDYYTNATDVAFNNNLNQIWQQKWIALFFNGLEPYIEVRRWLNYYNRDWNMLPFLSPPCSNINNNLLPLRFVYPDDERLTNSANFDIASSSLGGNTQNSTMWLLQ